VPVAVKSLILLMAVIVPFRTGVALKHQHESKLGAAEGNPLTVRQDLRRAHNRRCTMREEFASKGFLAVTVAGLVLLCSGLVAFARARARGTKLGRRRVEPAVEARILELKASGDGIPPYLGFTLRKIDSSEERRSTPMHAHDP
jgi:hypothetical protein